MIVWDSPHWGEQGHNVHLAGNGSWSTTTDPREGEQ